jgi:hypothetical protein
VGGSAPPSAPDPSSTPTDTVYYVGQMKVKFTSCPSVPCAASNPNRNPGQTVYVEMTYNPSNLVFLPTTFRFGWVTVNVPTTLPAYKVSTMVE